MHKWLVYRTTRYRFLCTFPVRLSYYHIHTSCIYEIYIYISLPGIFRNSYQSTGWIMCLPSIEGLTWTTASLVSCRYCVTIKHSTKKLWHRIMKQYLSYTEKFASQSKSQLSLWWTGKTRDQIRSLLNTVSSYVCEGQVTCYCPSRSRISIGNTFQKDRG